MLFFTADTHFNNDEVRRLWKRPFLNTNDMNQRIVAWWNKMIGKHDLVVIVGNVGTPEFLWQCHGRMLILPGIQEQITFKNNPEIVKNYERLNKCEIMIPGKKEYKFEGVPIDFISLNYTNSWVYGIKYKDFMITSGETRIADKSYINLYGAGYGWHKVSEYSIDIGMDANHFRPVSIVDIMDYRDKMTSTLYQKYMS